MLKLFPIILGLVIWSNFGVWSNMKLKIQELKEMVPLPNTSDIQELAEALFFNLHEDFSFVRDFRHKKNKAVDVCELSKVDAMKWCSKLIPIYNLTTGNYSVRPNEKPEECKWYDVIFYHTSSKPAQSKLRARKCPFGPDELFITTGNNRIPVYVLTWTSDSRKYLLIDHYVDDEEQTLAPNLLDNLKRKYDELRKNSNGTYE